MSKFDIDTVNINTIASLRIKKADHMLSATEILDIHNEAVLIYKMIKEDKEYLEENGVTYHLRRDVREYIERKLL